LDDEHALLLAAGLQKKKMMTLLAVIGNLQPACMRARIAKGTLQQLGLSNIPVGIGTEVFFGSQEYGYESKLPYLSKEHELHSNGSLLLKQTLEKTEDHTIILVLQSGLTDAAFFLKEHTDLCCKKIKKVAIMGGVQNCNGEILLTGKYMQPDNANNNTFDWAAATFLYARLQELGISMTVVMREAAYNCQVPFSMYDEMEKTNNPIGACLKNRQQPSLEKLWQAACSPPNAKIRGTLPNDRNRQWFVNVFCDGQDPGISDTEEIWPHTGRFNLYDPINLVAAVPCLQEMFFDPTCVEVNNIEHMVIGISKTKHGIKTPDTLRDFLCSTEIDGL